MQRDLEQVRDLLVRASRHKSVLDPEPTETQSPPRDRVVVGVEVTSWNQGIASSSSRFCSILTIYKHVILISDSGTYVHLV
ncbi:hypothetical protein LINPERPRIM_LOCUS13557, partial [Linum perenne]